MGIEISDLLKTSVELKIVSGYENWMNRIVTAISELSSPDEQKYNDEKLQSYKKAKSDLEKNYLQLKPFAGKLTPEEFHKNILPASFQ